MTVREREPTGAELQQNFDEMLRSVLAGGGLVTETGLDMETETALWHIARAYPDVPEALVDAARVAFAGQLDGANGRARQRELMRRLTGLEGQGQPGGPTGWAGFAAGLAQELAGLPAGAIVKIVESRSRPARFAQFVHMGAVLSAELVGGEFLDPALQAGDAGRAAIRALGWCEPDEYRTNWWAELRWPAASADYRRVADMVVGGLRDGYGLAGPELFNYDAWNERTGNSPVELPLLGLPRKSG